MGRIRRRRTRHAVVVTSAVAVLALATGCGAPSDPDPGGLRKTAPAPTDTLPAGACPTAKGPLHAAIDYVDFVQVGDVMYAAADPRTTVPAAEVGDRVGVVRCTFSGNTDNPWLVARDGDASFLPPGTELHAVAARPVAAAIAVRVADGWWLYRALP